MKKGLIKLAGVLTAYVAFPSLMTAQTYSTIYPTDDTYVCGALSASYQPCESQNYDGNNLYADYQNQSYFYSTFLRFDPADFLPYCSNANRVELVLAVHTPAGSPAVNVVRWRHIQQWDWREDTLTAQHIQDYINQYGWSTVRDFITTLYTIQNPTVVDITSAFNGACTENTPLTVSLEGDFSGNSYTLAWWDMENGAAGQKPFLRVYVSPTLPDLVVDSITISQSSVKQWERFWVAVNIKNQGDTVAPPTQAQLLIGSVPIHAWSVPQLYPGDTHSETLYVSWDQAGQQSIVAKADAGDLVDEISEINNTSSRDIWIQTHPLTAEYSVWIGGEGNDDAGSIDFILGAIAHGDPESFRIYLSDSIPNARDVPAVDIDVGDMLMYLASQRPSQGYATDGYMGVYRISVDGSVTPVSTETTPYIHAVYYDPARDSVWVVGGDFDGNSPTPYIHIYASSYPFSSTYRQISINEVGQITRLLIYDDIHVFVSMFLGGLDPVSKVLYFPYSATQDGVVTTSELTVVCSTQAPGYAEIIQDIFGYVMCAKLHYAGTQYDLVRLIPESSGVRTDTVAVLKLPEISPGTYPTVHGILGLTSSTDGRSRFLITTSDRILLLEDDPHQPSAVDIILEEHPIGGLYITWHMNQPVSVSEDRPKILNPTLPRSLVISGHTALGKFMQILKHSPTWFIYSADGRRMLVMNSENYPKIRSLRQGVYILASPDGHRIRFTVISP